MAVRFKRRLVPKFLRTQPDETVAAHDIACDECGAEELSEGVEWDKWWEDLKEFGWRARKEDGVWKHLCPECTGE